MTYVHLFLRHTTIQIKYDNNRHFNTNLTQNTTNNIPLSNDIEYLMASSLIEFGVLKAILKLLLIYSW